MVTWFSLIQIVVGESWMLFERGGWGGVKILEQNSHLKWKSVWNNQSPAQRLRVKVSIWMEMLSKLRIFYMIGYWYLSKCSLLSTLIIRKIWEKRDQIFFKARDENWGSLWTYNRPAVTNTRLHWLKHTLLIPLCKT